MKHGMLQIKVLVVVIFVLAGYFIWVSTFGVKEVDPALQREAEANSPECNYEKTEIDTNRIYTAKEFEKNSAQAKACLEAKLKYIKSKKALESR